MQKLVVLRHGQSQWNLENRFTGWVDVDLTEQGRAEAAQAAQRLLQSNVPPIDVAYTSCLKRAIRTMWIVLDGLDRMWVDVHHNWRLNERHYGTLQGLNKAETAKKYGDEQVHIWRRSYDTPPDAVGVESEMYPGNESRYQHIPQELLPTTESLMHVRDRVEAVWQSTIVKQVQQGKQVLIAAHGNSLRALAMYLTGMSSDEVMDFNIGTGVPLVFTMRNAHEASDMNFLDS